MKSITIVATGTEEKFEQLLSDLGLDEDNVEGSEMGFDGELVRYSIFIPYEGEKERLFARIEQFVTVEEVKG